jgi:hypothetical protein
MTAFARSFPLQRLPEPLPAWFADLLRAVAPAGSTARAGAGEHLRLAIRDNYLSFYLAGQSLALVRFDRAGQLVADIHHKYVHSGAVGQAHVTLGPSGYPDATRALQPYASALLPTWMAAARRHTGEEKAFVDALLAANANVVDLEMALPAYDGAPAGPVAPRMDLVALEPVPGTVDHRIVFWEAKRVTDTRCRCRGDAAPEVVAQLATYTTWLAHGDHRATVAAAYQQCCRQLVALHALAGTLRDDVPPLGAAIVAVAAPDAPLPLVDDEPRLIIDDRERNASFTANGHLAKLRERCGVFVQMVQSVDDVVLAARRATAEGRGGDGAVGREGHAEGPLPGGGSERASAPRNGEGDRPRGSA